jgi:hypothetical protein
MHMHTYLPNLNLRQKYLLTAGAATVLVLGQVPPSVTKWRIKHMEMMADKWEMSMLSADEMLIEFRKR